MIFLGIGALLGVRVLALPFYGPPPSKAEILQAAKEAGESHGHIVDLFQRV